MKRFFVPLALTFLVAGGVCCSDDGTADPSGAVALNMMDEDNGKTELEDSGIYIDRGQNFVAGDDCLLIDLGAVRGLGAVALGEIGVPVKRAAVVSGHGYAAFRPRTLLRFPSGKLALPAWQSEVNYMKFYVQSPLRSGGETVGAAVKYLFAQPASCGLPEYGAEALVVARKDYDPEREVSLTLPESDFEYDFHGSDAFDCEKRGRRLVFRFREWRSGSYALYLRIRGSYTRVCVVMR